MIYALFTSQGNFNPIQNDIYFYEIDLPWFHQHNKWNIKVHSL